MPETIHSSRRNSLTSLSTMDSRATSSSGYGIRSNTTQNLFEMENKFIRPMSKKVPSGGLIPNGGSGGAVSTGSPKMSDNFHKTNQGTYYFPNGEVFRPRTTVTKRHRPSKISQGNASSMNNSIDSIPGQIPVQMPQGQDIPIRPHYPDVIPRSSSFSSMSSKNSATSAAYLTKSVSFTNLKHTNKQNLVKNLRSNRQDTATNLKLSFNTNPPKNATFVKPSSLLVNQRLQSTNLIKNNSSISLIDEQQKFSDSNPSSLSNFNVNRSSSTTPTTSINTSEDSCEFLKLAEFSEANVAISASSNEEPADSKRFERTTTIAPTDNTSEKNLEAATEEFIEPVIGSAEVSCSDDASSENTERFLDSSEYVDEQIEKHNQNSKMVISLSEEEKYDKSSSENTVRNSPAQSLRDGVESKQTEDETLENNRDNTLTFVDSIEGDNTLTQDNESINDAMNSQSIQKNNSEDVILNVDKDNNDACPKDSILEASEANKKIENSELKESDFKEIISNSKELPFIRPAKKEPILEDIPKVNSSVGNNDISKDEQTNSLSDTRAISSSENSGNERTAQGELVVSNIQDDNKLKFFDFASESAFNKLLNDDQAEVPPRGDLIVINRNKIRKHERASSSISSFNSIVQLSGGGEMNQGSPKFESPRKQFNNNGTSPRMSIYSEQYPNHLNSTSFKENKQEEKLYQGPSSQHDEIKDKEEILGNKQKSMLDVISNVKNLPPPRSPEKIVISKHQRNLQKQPSQPSLKSNNPKMKKSSSVANLKSFFKKVFSGKSSSKSDHNTKTRDTKVLASRHSATVNPSIDATAYIKPAPPAISNPNEVSRNLSRSSHGNISIHKELPDILPQIDSGPDMLEEILSKINAKLDEENFEQSKSKVSKLFTEPFLKDDELTTDQIKDQQIKDVPVEYDTYLQPSDPSSDDDYIDDNIRFLRDELYWTEFTEDGPHGYGGSISRQHSIKKVQPENNKYCLTDEQLSIFDNLKEYEKRSLPIYLKHIEQFKDFKELEVSVRYFQDISSLPDSKTENLTTTPILKRDNSNTTKKSVSFSKNIFISETFPPEMYKRYNKSVTQYNLTEPYQISKIKEELNQFKCHEMLVHEDSQDNTQFFY